VAETGVHGENHQCRALQSIPAPTNLWLVRKHVLLASKSVQLASQFVLYNSNMHITVLIPIHTI
jgi:hypothetical protein